MKKNLLESMNKDLLDEISSKIDLKDTNRYQINKKDIKILFDIFNEKLFDSKLPTIDIFVEKFDKKRDSRNGKIYVGQFIVDGDIASFLSFLKHRDFSKLKQKIYLRFLDQGELQFESIVKSLIHEMIHYYDYLYGQGKTGMILNIIANHYGDKPIYDTHGTYFKEHMKRIKKNSGIEVPLEFDYLKSLPKKLQEKIDNLKESESLSINDCDNEWLVKFAKILRAGIKDDGTNYIEADNNGYRIVIS